MIPYDGPEPNPLEKRVVEALARRREIAKTAREFRALEAGLADSGEGYLEPLRTVQDVPVAGCNPPSAVTWPPGSPNPHTCDKANPQSCPTAVFWCYNFTCKDGFNCQSQNDFGCLDEYTCSNGDHTCSAGHTFMCTDDNTCSGTGFTCSAPNNPPCSPTTSPAYTVPNGDGTGGDFMCGYPGGDADTFNCTGSKFECKAASEFDCQQTSNFTCKSDFDCNSTKSGFDCWTTFTCPSSVDCPSNYHCYNSVSCPSSQPAYNCSVAQKYCP